MLQRKKLCQAASFMKQTDIDLWVTLARESTMARDPVLPMLADMYFSRLAAVVVEKGGRALAIVSFLEEASAKQLGVFDEVIAYGGTSEFSEAFGAFLGRDSRKTIALNFSKDDPAQDGLSHGNYLAFMDILEGLNFQGRVVPSQPILDEIRSVKNDEEVQRIQEAIRITQRIFDDAKGFIKDGVTERQIFDFFQAKAKEYGTYPSWSADQCPGVKVSLDSPSGHCGPTDIPARKGSLVCIDFGVVYEGYCSDMQRMYYLLRDGETDAPEQAKKAFRVVCDTIDGARRFMKEGVTGFETDRRAREYLTGFGFQEWPHGLGHQVGTYVHDGGALLCFRKKSNGPLIDKPLKAGNVFAVEPATYVDAGYLCVEEMVYITPEGAVFLTEPQKELYLL